MHQDFALSFLWSSKMIEYIEAITSRPPSAIRRVTGSDRNQIPRPAAKTTSIAKITATVDGAMND
jgi:hypothetical protein